jgi:hypothetical protein
MPHVLCLLERIGGISANKVYFRRIEDVEFDVSWRRGEWLLKLSRHADVLPVADSKLLDKALTVLNHQSRATLVSGTLRCFKAAPVVVEMDVGDGKIIEINEKVLEGKPS